MKASLLFIVGIVLLTLGCDSADEYVPSEEDLAKRRKLEARNLDGDGVWDPSNYRWDIRTAKDDRTGEYGDTSYEEPADTTPDPNEVSPPSSANSAEGELPPDPRVPKK